MSSEIAENLCRTCSYKFLDRADQVLHYKLDWHLYNVKQKLRNLSPISEEEFAAQCEDDLSSLSGSDSEEDDVGVEDMVTSQFLDDSPELSDAVICSPHVIFRSQNNFYKCLSSLLFSNQFEITDQVLSEILTQRTVADSTNGLKYKGRIAVFLYSAQHFAGAVYDNEQLILHKTYHRYTVRAKQGTVQGIRDGKGNAPKSYGASLRRYNQIALFNDVEKLMLEWSGTLNTCGVIFHRTAVHNRHVFEKVKEKIGDKKNKIRTIPFTTYRPTLKETERVYKLLTKITKVFEKEFQDVVAAKKARESSELESSSKVTHSPQTKPVNPKSIPNSHIKQRPEKIKPVQTPVPQTDVQFHFYEDPENVYFKILAAVKSQNQQLFVSLLESSRNDNLDLDQPLDNNNSLLHRCACVNDPSFVKELLHRGANPEVKNGDNKTSYEVAQHKEVRDEFRRYMGLFPDKWDYKNAKIPSPLTPEMEEEQARKKADKKKAQRAAKNKRDKEKKAAKKEAEKRDEEKLIAEAQKLRMRQLTPRERCLLAAEGRLATERGRGCVSGKCANCDTGLDGLVPFERLEYKYCSVTCVREHKDKL